MPRLSTRYSAGGYVLERTVSETAQHSIEIGRNARGDWTFNAKVYFDEPGEDPLRLAFDLYRRFLELKEAHQKVDDGPASGA